MGLGWTIRRCIAVAPLVAAAAGPALTADEPEPPPPEHSELEERATARLTQVDVTVTGPPELIRDLTRDDFRVRIGLKRVRDFEVDGFCGDPVAEPATPVEALVAAADPRRRPASYVFYFDQMQLTLTGRHRAMQLARDVIPELVRGGSRGMIVSSARELVTVARFDDDADALLGALGELDTDRTQWDFYATQEGRRVDEVLGLFGFGGAVENAIAAARTYQREERWRTERSLRRVESVLARLATIEAPKALIYFADTLRSNAGEHYLSFFDDGMVVRHSVLAVMQADATTAGLPFDRVVNQAAAQGVRVYTVQAEGLVSHFRTPTGPQARSGTPMAPGSSRVRVVDAQNTLSSLSRETGGDAFLNGASSRAIVERIRSDFSCLYLISFDPGNVDEDSPYMLGVKVVRPGVEARSRGRLLVQSESSRLEARLLGAFAAPGAAEEDVAVQGELVPLGFGRGRYSALVQVAVPGIAIGDSTWDLGASLVSGNRVRAEAKGRLQVTEAGVPVVLESAVSFPPGPYQVRAVAHEMSTDVVASSSGGSLWPDPRRGPASVGPIAVLRPAGGAFTRDGAVRRNGSLALPPDRPVLTSDPTAFVGLVCRGRASARGLRIERLLRGAEAVSFPPIEPDLSRERCVQVRDVVPAGSLRPGVYSYEIRVLDGDFELASGTRELFAVDPS